MNKEKILIVEDESIVALDIKTILESSGYDVVGPAGTGRQAIMLSKKFKPDLVLMDIILKGKMNGIEAASEINKQLSIPVIYLTAYSSKKIVQQAKKTEPFGYIIKPYLEKDLTVAVEVALHKLKIEKSLAENRELMHTTLTSIGDAVITTDINGIIKFMNPAAEAMSGRKQDDAVNQKFHTVFRMKEEQNNLSFSAFLHMALRGKIAAGSKRNFALTRKDKSSISVEGNVSPIKDTRGKITGVVFILRDITKSRLAEEEIHNLNQFLNVIIDDAAVWLSVVDWNSNLIIWNKAAERISGYTREQIKNTATLQKLLYPDPDYRNYVISRIEDITEINEFIEEFEATISTRENEKKIVSWHMRNLTNVKGKPLGLMTLGRDITEEKKLTKQLHKKFRELAILNEKKTDFLNILVHELNTPLTIIIGITQLLPDSGIDSETKKDLTDNLFRQLNNLKKIMQDIFMVDIENQREITFKFKKLVLNDLITELIEDTKIFLDIRNQQLLTSFKEDNITVLGNGARLIESMFCILQNASKFSEDNKKIFITLQLKKNEAAIEFLDQGIGIEEDALDIIFNPFYEHQDIMYHHSGNFEYKSSRLGMGLYWAKNNIKKHNGRIEVESTPGKGSKFTIFLPLYEAPDN